MSTGAIADANARVIEFYNERGQETVCPVMSKGVPFHMYTRNMAKIRRQKPEK